MYPERFLIVADESVDGRIILALRNAGFTVFSIAAEYAGIPDDQVIEIAKSMHAFLITEDKDFGDELVYKKSTPVGSLLLRLSDVPINGKIKLVLEAINMNFKDMQNAFSVLTDKKLRIRKYS